MHPASRRCSLTPIYVTKMLSNLVTVAICLPACRCVRVVQSRENVTTKRQPLGIRGKTETETAYERALTRLAAMHRLSKRDDKFFKLREVFDNKYGHGSSDDTKRSLIDFLNRDGL